MSGTNDMADVYAAIEKTSQLLGVPCSRDRVWPILAAYEDVLPQAVIAFRVATDARHVGELDCRMTVPKDVDPYARALASGLTAETDHPVGKLLSEIPGHCPVDCYGIDFGIVSGFQKVWAFFPSDDLQELSRLAGIPSMPRSLPEGVSFFSKHGLEKVSLIGIDYEDQTANVYFGALPADCREPEAILSMHREIGLPEPSEQMLKLGREAFGIYFTLRWESPKIERISFAVITPDPMALPVRFAPRIEQFVRNLPYGATDPKLVYVAMKSTGEEYHKLQTYYRWRPRVLDLMQLPGSDSAQEPG